LQQRCESWAAADSDPNTHRSKSVNYEVWNGYVLVAIALFAMLLYVGLLYVGFIEFRARLSKNNTNKKRSRNRITTRRLRNPKVSGH